VRKIWIGLLILLGIGLAIILWWSSAENEKIPVVETFIVQPTTLRQEIFTTGTVVPNARQELYSYSAVPIVKVCVREGDRVKSGQVLVELDTALVDAQIKQAEAGVEAARAALRLAQEKLEAAKVQAFSQRLPEDTPPVEIGQSTSEISDLNSSLNPTLSLGNPSLLPDPATLYEMPQPGDPALVESVPADLEQLKSQAKTNLSSNPRSIPTFEGMMPPPHISRSVDSAAASASGAEQALIDQAQTGVMQAAAALKQAEAVLKAAQVQREQLLLKAAISGTVTELNAEVGNIASYQNPLAVISDLSRLKVRAELNEVDGAQVKPGQEVVISGAILGTKTIKGTVEKVSLEAKSPNTFQATGSKYVDVLIALAEEAEELKPGYTVEVKMILASKEGVLAVPYEALFQENHKTYVYTVSEGKLIKKEVTPGAADDTQQEILSGLQQGDQVVLSPLSSFYEGMAVKVAGSKDVT